MTSDHEPTSPAQAVSTRDLLVVIMVGLGAGTIMIALGSRVLTGRGVAPNISFLLAQNDPARAVDAALARRDTRLLAFRLKDRLITPGSLTSLAKIRRRYGIRIVNPTPIADAKSPPTTMPEQAIRYATRYNQIMRQQLVLRHSRNR